MQIFKSYKMSYTFWDTPMTIFGLDAISDFFSLKKKIFLFKDLPGHLGTV